MPFKDDQNEEKVSTFFPESTSLAESCIPQDGMCCVQQQGRQLVIAL